MQIQMQIQMLYLRLLVCLVMRALFIPILFMKMSPKLLQLKVVANVSGLGSQELVWEGVFECQIILRTVWEPTLHPSLLPPPEPLAPPRRQSS
jgi:hypothetical protein